ncbi:phosphonate C-P lyase system protein PhnH [Streptomyces carpinensis]|uniref:Phosphonate C-P lyase system protein PhnH n=1 Tax=Streptomyces carpinensis TaxID=66369 RepID=A0ABV1W7I0_9ACTN|nr:phosphonate C-P lyase system protein PhnH [Streptomyces carpinensis]
MTTTRTLTYGETIRRIGRAPEDSQRDYRRLIDVLGRPSRIAAIDTVDGVPPVIILAAGLADVDVTVAVLDEDWERPFFVATGATRTDITRAQHIIATQPLTVDQLTSLERGDALHPERGARVFAAVTGFGDAVDGADSTTLILSGPGNDGEARLSVDGLAPEFFDALAIANADFPAGIDLVLVAPDGRIAAIPRSSRISIEKPEKGA